MGENLANGEYEKSVFGREKNKMVRDYRPLQYKPLSIHSPKHVTESTSYLISENHRLSTMDCQTVIVVALLVAPVVAFDQLNSISDFISCTGLLLTRLPELVSPPALLHLDFCTNRLWIITIPNPFL